jgi:hypothetical protein
VLLDKFDEAAEVFRLVTLGDDYPTFLTIQARYLVDETASTATRSSAHVGARSGICRKTIGEGLGLRHEKAAYSSRHVFDEHAGERHSVVLKALLLRWLVLGKPIFIEAEGVTHSPSRGQLGGLRTHFNRQMLRSPVGPFK